MHTPTHAEAGYLRPKGEWTCFNLMGGRGHEYCEVSDEHNKNRHVRSDTLEPYPDFVRATKNNADGATVFYQTHEIFEVIDPWETKKGDFLRVKRTEGRSKTRDDDWVMIPISDLEASESPVWLRQEQPVAV